MNSLNVKLVGLLCGLLSIAPAFAMSVRINCPKPAEVTFPTEQETYDYLRTQRIDLLNDEKITLTEISQFLGSFARFPSQLHQNIVESGGSILLINGAGVTEDPAWNKADILTVEGTRNWSDIPGSGGSPKHSIPTRMVVNHLYDGHGAIDLFLHEHAHTLDAVYGDSTISKSKTWTDVIAAEPNVREFLSAVCALEYCNTYHREAFADLFTNYHACPESRAQMEREIPLVADFFSKLTDANVFKTKSIFSLPTRSTATPEELAEREEVARRRRELVTEVKDTVVREVKETFNGLRDRFFGRRKPKPIEE